MYNFFNKDGIEIFSNEDVEINGNLIPKFYIDMESVSTSLVSTSAFYILQDDLTLNVVKAEFEEQTISNFFTYSLDVDAEGENFIVKEVFENTGREVLSNTQKLYEIHVGFSSDSEVYQYEHLHVYVNNVLSFVVEFYCEAIPLDMKFKEMAVDNLKHDFREEDYKAIFSSDVDEELPDYKIINRKYKEFIFEYLNLVGKKSSYASLINIIKYFEYGDKLSLKEFWENNITENTGNSTDFNRYAQTTLDSNFNDTNAFLRKGFVKTNFLGLFYKLNSITGFDENGDEILELSSNFTIEEIIIKLNYLRNYLERSAYLPEPFEITSIVGEFLIFHSFIHAYWDSYCVSTRFDISLNKSKLSAPTDLYFRNRTYNNIEGLDSQDYVINDPSVAKLIENPNNGNLDFYTTYKRELCAILECEFEMLETVPIRDIRVKLEKLNEISLNYDTLIEIKNIDVVDVENLAFVLLDGGEYRINYILSDFYSVVGIFEKIVNVHPHTPCMRTFSLVSAKNPDAVSLDFLEILRLNESVKTENVADQRVYDLVNYEYSSKIINKSIGVSDFDLRRFKSSQNRDVTVDKFGVNHYMFRYDVYGDGNAGERRLELSDAFGNETIIFPDYDGMGDIDYIYQCLTLISKTNNRIFRQFNYNIEWYEKDVGFLIPVIVGLSKGIGTSRVFTKNENDDSIIDLQDIEILHSSIAYCDIYAVDAGNVSIEIIEDSAVVYQNAFTVSDLEDLLSTIQNIYPEDLIFGIRNELGDLERIRVISKTAKRLEIKSAEIRGNLIGEKTEPYKGLKLNTRYGEDYGIASVIGATIDPEFSGDFYDIKWDLYKGGVLIDTQNSYVYRNVLIDRGSYSLNLSYKFRGVEYEQERRGVFFVR